MLSLLETSDRIKVVAQQISVGRVAQGRHQVGGINQNLALGLEPHDLLAQIVTRSRMNRESLENFGVSLERLELTGRYKRLPQLWQIAGAVALVGVLGFLEFSPLHQMGGVLKGGLSSGGVAPRVVVVQVRVNHQVDVGRLEAHRFQTLENGGVALEGMNSPEFFVALEHSGLNQDILVFDLNEQWVGPEWNAVEFVRLEQFFP